MSVNVQDTGNDTIVLTVQVPGAQGPAGPAGPTGAPGANGPATTLTIGSVTTGVSAAASLVGTAPNQTLNLTIPQGPKGDKGDPGPAGADGTGIQIAGEVSTYSALPTGLTSADKGKAYIVDSDGKLYIWTGTAFPPSGSGQTFTGPTGPANTLTIGSTTTLAAGSSASASLTGTAPNQTLNLGIPAGAPGASGVGVIPGGNLGAILIKASSTDYDTQWQDSAIIATPSTVMVRDGAGRAQVANPSASGDIATKGYVDALGTTTATASTVARRDASGNGTFNRLYTAGSDPATNAEVTPKSYVDAQNTTTLNTAKSYTDSQFGSGGGGTSAPTANNIVRRDSAGRAQVVDPSANADIATKNYVDNTAGVSAPTASKLVRRDASGRAQVADPSASADIATKNYVDTQFGNAVTISAVDSEIDARVDLAPIVRRYNDSTGTIAPRPATSRPVWWILPSSYTITYDGTTAGGTVKAVNNLDIISRY